MCYGFETFVKISLSNEISHFLIFTSVSSSIYIQGENLLLLLPLNHLFNTHILVLYYALGQGFCKLLQQCLWLLFHCFASDFQIFISCQDMTLNPNLLHSATCLPDSPRGCLSDTTKPQLLVPQPQQLTLNTCGIQGTSSQPTLASFRAAGPHSNTNDTQGQVKAKSKLCTHQHLPLQTAYTHGTGHLGRVRPGDRIPVVRVGNSNVQKPGKSLPTLSLLGPSSSLEVCCLVQQILFLPFSSLVLGAWSKSPPSHPRTEQHLLPHQLLPT